MPLSGIANAPFGVLGCGDASLFGCRAQRAGGSIERLRQVGDDVVYMLDPHRQPHITIGHTGIALLVGCQLRMRG